VNYSLVVHICFLTFYFSTQLKKYSKKSGVIVVLLIGLFHNFI
jgi:hypothetical protein